jgi:hypothetical protein
MGQGFKEPEIEICRDRWRQGKKQTGIEGGRDRRRQR